MQDPELEQAYELFKRFASEVESAGSLSAEQLRIRLRRVSRRVLDLLESEDDKPEDTISGLQRQSEEIADDLRRVQRLMRDRAAQEE